jgi:hypothetical protein
VQRPPAQSSDPRHAAERVAGVVRAQDTTVHTTISICREFESERIEEKDMSDTQTPNVQPGAIPTLGSTATLTTRGGKVEGVLVRRDARNQALPAMLSIQTTDLSDRSRSTRIQIPEGTGHDIAFTPPKPGTVLTLSTDRPVEMLYHVADSVEEAQAWLEEERPMWHASGDYRLLVI